VQKINKTDVGFELHVYKHFLLLAVIFYYTQCVVKYTGNVTHKIVRVLDNYTCTFSFLTVCIECHVSLMNAKCLYR
jgi:hypothetical protein